MRREFFNIPFGILSIFFMAAYISGCSTDSTTTGPSSTSTAMAPEAEDHGHDHDEDGHHDDEHADHDHDASEEDAAIENALAQLSPEDRAAAEQQKICPVSEEPLGSMGKPMKVTVDGRDVFICCDGCEEAVNEDPEKYLARLPQPE